MFENYSHVAWLPWDGETAWTWFLWVAAGECASNSQAAAWGRGEIQDPGIKNTDPTRVRNRNRS